MAATGHCGCGNIFALRIAKLRRANENLGRQVREQGAELKKLKKRVLEQESVGNTRYRDTLETQGKYPLLERDVQSRGSVGRCCSIF
jgi:hypothetical protein